LIKILFIYVGDIIYLTNAQIEPIDIFKDDP